LSRATAVFATVFFLTSLGLTYFSSHKNKPIGVMESHSLAQPAVPADAAKQVPVVPAQGGAAGSKAGEIPK
jgi:preprotein translocase subunit SecG